ncbi:MAG: ATP-binding cassette domain-containing protein [Acidimicrobiales bacterium]
MSLQLHGSVMVGELTLGLDLEIEPNERVALVGTNGAGKTSILHLLAGLVALDEGELAVDGVVWDRPADHRWVAPADRHLGVVFQDLRLFDHLDVIANVAFGPRSRGVGHAAADEAARAWLARVGLADRATDHPADLSGGQRQRTALARALATDPTLMLLDEPFAAADVAIRPDLRAMVAQAGARYLVLATHEPDDLAELSDQVLVVDDGAAVRDDATAPATPFLRGLLSG